jgi:acetyl-CoA carboxylase biotin carboxyl carrier protein
MTDLDDIERLLDLMDARGLEELEVEREGLRVRFRKPGGPVAPAVQPPAPAPGAPATPPQAAAPEADEAGLAIIKSPIVGTFYRSPEPGADAFVEVGSAVRKGQVVCIIEAMKLMNEIDADQDGEVVTVYVEDGQPVQYGESLFAIRTA